MQLKRCVVACSVVLHSGHVGDVVFVGSILCFCVVVRMVIACV